MTGRNDQCSCGSGKKYKQCFLMESEDCFDFLFKEHEKREKSILSFFVEARGEIAEVIKSEKNSDRVKVIQSFVLVEIMASYWNEYRKAGLKPNDRLEAWINEFCLNEKNKIYEKSKRLKVCTSLCLCRLRNSLIHFFGLPNEKTMEGVNVVIMGDEIAQEKEDGFVSDLKETTLIIRPNELWDLFINGYSLMVDKFLKNIDTDKSSQLVHMRGIKRIYKKAQEESALVIKIPRDK